MTEEEQIALAIQMSMNEANPTPSTNDSAKEETKPETTEPKPTEMETDVSLLFSFS